MDAREGGVVITPKTRGGILEALMEVLDPSDGRLEGDMLHDIVVGFSATWWAELLRYSQGQYASELVQSVFWHLVRRTYPELM